jgi:pimeloyl-ACP methyl ester carboxylesterase
VMPPDYAEQFCSKLQNCHLLTIPGLGHGPFDMDAWTRGDCYDAITTKFLDDGIIDDSCVKQMRAPAFR